MENYGKEALYFQHIMHPLMPLQQISDIKLPDFIELYYTINKDSQLNISRDELKTLLLNHDKASASMFILRNLKENQFSVMMKTGIKLTVNFPLNLFSSLGIWWNKSGYPDEKNHQRSECALEPISGNSSMLKDAFNEGLALKVEQETSFSWRINWIVQKV
ncbi:MAG: hypothetical protein U9O87_09880 [Verrucomicrobiota bacterium]|nr:hypothetical protein [Verrucomicrobiota bacterium]